MSDANILEYKGYRGKVEVSMEDSCLHGKILGINALVTFESDDLTTIKQAFRESVDNYLDLCERNGLVPEKEYGGVFNVRVKTDTHRRLSIMAEARGKSLNAIANAAFDHYLDDVDGHHERLSLTINNFELPSQFESSQSYSTKPLFTFDEGVSPWPQKITN